MLPKLERPLTAANDMFTKMVAMTKQPATVPEFNAHISNGRKRI